MAAASRVLPPLSLNTFRYFLSLLLLLLHISFQNGSLSWVYGFLGTYRHEISILLRTLFVFYSLSSVVYNNSIVTLLIYEENELFFFFWLKSLVYISVYIFNVYIEPLGGEKSFKHALYRRKCLASFLLSKSKAAIQSSLSWNLSGIFPFTVPRELLLQLVHQKLTNGKNNSCTFFHFFIFLV